MYFFLLYVNIAFTYNQITGLRTGTTSKLTWSVIIQSLSIASIRCVCFHLMKGKGSLMPISTKCDSPMSLITVRNSCLNGPTSNTARPFSTIPSNLLIFIMFHQGLSVSNNSRLNLSNTKFAGLWTFVRTSMIIYQYSFFSLFGLLSGENLNLNKSLL